MKKTKNAIVAANAFSLAEALITLLVICVIAIASAPVITKKHKARINLPHGVYACYWNGDNLVAKYIINGQESDGKVVFDSEEQRYGCEFNPPTNAKNFVATIVGGGGGGAGAGIMTGSRMFTQNTTKTIEEPAYYQFLVAGAGGSGGSVWMRKSNCYNAKTGWACSGTGSPGAVVVSNYKFLPKGTQVNVVIGAGGSGANIGSHAGYDGGDSSVRLNDKDNSTIIAQGGGGGFTMDYNEDPNWLYYKTSYTASAGSGFVQSNYVSKGNVSRQVGENQQGPIQSAARSGAPGGYAYKGFTINRAKVETHIPTWYEHERIGAYTLDENWNIKTFRKSNAGCTWSVKPSDRLHSTYAMQGGLNALRPYRNSMMTKPFMEEFGISGSENQETPFASGSAGEVDDGACKYYESGIRNGGSGVVAYKYIEVFAGKGGNAGSVLQLPYAEMPQKTLLFPGKGGKGGQGAPNVRKSIGIGGSSYRNNEVTAGSEGQSSYIKNGSQVLQGTGAPMVVPNDDETYSSDYNDAGMPVGGNGILSNVLTNKKTGTGGLGGLFEGNDSIHGATQTMFRNGEAVSGFNNIYGAGAGGGGGTVTVETSSNYSAGNGGQGASGLVFIQW